MDEKMMQMLKAKGTPVEGHDKEAKMDVLKELVRHMYDILGADVDDMMKPKEDEQKVVVSAENPEDLEKGLDMAQDVVEKIPEMSNDDEMEEDEDIY